VGSPSAFAPAAHASSSSLATSRTYSHPYGGSGARPVARDAELVSATWTAENRGTERARSLCWRVGYLGHRADGE
jgi:hypothetical protein